MAKRRFQIKVRFKDESRFPSCDGWETIEADNAFLANRGAHVQDRGQLQSRARRGYLAGRTRGGIDLIHK